MYGIRATRMQGLRLQHKIRYRPLKSQTQFHSSTKSKVMLFGGYGSGKTFALCQHAFKLMTLNRGLPGGIVTPTMKMFKRDVLPTFEEICLQNMIPYRYFRADGYFHFPYTDSKLHVFHGEDQGASIKGPNLAFMLINEITLIDQPTFNAAISRARLKHAALRQIAGSGTPEDFNWVYDYFVLNQRNDTDVYYGNTADNFHNAPEYVQMLRESYDEKLVKRYVEGQWINIRGNQAAYKFNRAIHTAPDVEKIPYYPVWITMDFNVTPMAATLWNRCGPDQKHMLRAFDEICIEGSDTHEMCRAIRQKTQITDEIVIFPDPGGASRSTKSRGASDIDILKDHGFRDIRYKPRIPSVRDCMNALNNLFDKNRVILNSKTCKNAIADLEQCVVKKDVFELDKADLKRTHWLDGMKNMAEYEFPSRRPSEFREVRAR